MHELNSDHLVSALALESGEEKLGFQKAPDADRGRRFD